MRDYAGEKIFPPAPPIPRSAQDDWTIPDHWDRIEEGMSEEQVVAILGSPTKREEQFLSYVQLFYEGEVEGSGFVSGSITLERNQVAAWMTDRPVFNP